jgi:DNA polymerase I-like protein with 3'-5' exonuclease and polymerase domains
LYRGETGVYLSREVSLNGQKLYFPFIDIDGRKDHHGDEKIENAILNATLTWKILKELGVAGHFKIIATGNTGFRIISNILFNSETYQAFVDLVISEMPHIIDIQPTRDTGNPHQLFVYKGHSFQNKKQLVDGNSVVVSAEVFENETLDANYYRSITAGKLDPDAVINFMNWFFNFMPITDLKALGAFGEKLDLYRQLSKEIRVNPFEYIQFRKRQKPIALDVMQEMLAKKGIPSKIEKRGRNLAISFSGLPCPACKKISANARAYPPDYTLRCFNINCAANKGISLIKWAGIKNKGAVKTKNSKGAFDLQPPTEFQDLKSARDIICEELETTDDTLIISTPGVGKTRQTLNQLANYPKDKLVIYSAYNKDLQREAYEKVMTLSDEHDKFHLIQPRDEICIKKDELKQITSKGYSPAQILCPRCECRLHCDYYRQRENMEAGVFFVTHHMLQYLERRVPNPDLIILDENLKGGFLLEDSCTELQMRTLATVLSGVDYLLVNNLMVLGQQIGNQILKTKSFPEIINGRKLTNADINEDTIIGLLAKRNGRTEIKIIKEIKRIINVIGQHSPGELYHKGVNLKTVEWLKGLISVNRYSYMLVTENGAFRFNTKYITPLGYTGTPIKILDATGDARSARALVNRKLKVVKADVEWMSDKLHIQVNTSRGVMKYATDEDIKKLLIEMLNHTAAKKVMVITYKFLKERVLRICNSIDPSRQYLDYHFIGPRGINAFKECDAVLVIGLPYSNLNSAAQDACILFPYDKDDQIRFDWVEACMQWEIVQNIHRIRPVNKSSVDIIIASKYWPTILPEPDKIIDRSRSNDWKSQFIQRLEPWVKEFGFFSPDIGYLAGVFLKQKKEIAKEFRSKIFDIIRAYEIANNQDKVNSNTSQLLGREGCYIGMDGCFKVIPGINDEKKTILKLIVVLYILYYLNLLKSENILPLRILKQIQSAQEQSTSSHIYPSNTNQLAELIIYFKQKNPHFKNFRIKLPHARGNYVNGVGDEKRVKEFYEQLNEFEIFGKIDIETFRLINKSLTSVNPIPGGYAVVYIPDDDDKIIYAGYGDKFIPIPVSSDLEEFKKGLNEIIKDNENIKIVTNNGKALARKFISAGLPGCEIIDVLLNEKIIRNGEVALKNINIAPIFKQYDMAAEVEIGMMLSQLYQVWVSQQKLISDLELVNIHELEKRVLWVTAKMELAGVGVDVDRMLEYQENIQNKMAGIEKELRDSIPETIPLNDSRRLHAYLVKTFRLEISSIDQHSIKAIKDKKQSSILRQALEYRRLKKENDDIEKYVELIGDDDRVRDSIEQINTKTGRFYRLLQTVKKDGPMRSFFRAKEGYKFIVADYSQQEARIIAGLANDKKSIEIFKRDLDIYLEVAMSITVKPASECQEYRKVAKTIVLGLNNGRGEYSICDALNGAGIPVDPDDVTGFILRYNMDFEDIYNWRNKIARHGKDQGYLTTALGRRLRVTEETSEGSLYNFPVQGTAADGFKLALTYLNEKLKNLDAQIVHILHDEVIVEAKADIADDVAKIAKACMEDAFEKLIPNVPFKVEPEIKASWSDP